MTLYDWFESLVQPCKITLMSRPRKDSMKSWLMEERFTAVRTFMANDSWKCTDAYTIALFDFPFLCLKLTCPVLSCFPSNLLGGFILSSSPRRWWSLVASQAHFLSYVICNFVGLRTGAVDVEFWLHSQLSRCCLCCPNWKVSQTLISSSSASHTYILNMIMTHRTLI